MPRDLRISRMLHVLIHMDRHLTLATSEQIADMISTNPVVVRRIMAGLRDKGIVTSEKGHGGGWRLARPLAGITLHDVYDAVGRPPLFNIGSDAEPAKCLVENAVNTRLESALRDAEVQLLAQFGAVTVDDIAQDFERGFAALQQGGKAPCANAAHHDAAPAEKPMPR